MAFHRAFDFPIANAPKFPRQETVWFRKDLIEEEIREIKTAMEEDDMVGIADGIADAIYVLVGCAITYGIPLEAVWNRVQKANMAKLGSDGKPVKSAAGKAIKPPGWTPPNEDIRTLLIEAGWQP